MGCIICKQSYTNMKESIRLKKLKYLEKENPDELDTNEIKQGEHPIIDPDSIPSPILNHTSTQTDESIELDKDLSEVKLSDNELSNNELSNNELSDRDLSDRDLSNSIVHLSDEDNTRISEFGSEYEIVG